MSDQPQFGAPWSKLLYGLSAFCVLLCVGLAAMGALLIPPSQAVGRLLMIVLPFLILSGGLFFMVRGYSIQNQTLIVHRLGWVRKVDLSALVSAAHDPKALERAFKVVGNGGLFAFSGWFRNQKLGNFTLYGTDLSKSVVLRFPGKVVVVTPHAPEQFVLALTPQTEKPLPLRSGR